ncbi:hypothetical protein BpHYR1_051066 [Brachionus plicatilis]|uniref:Uncharacterized protein n=1 Tax=Brachionus plicatilis TaxID=10195 RepID=A0A3M7QVA3_BRAPC|nr:hypothetical protein BpHYR1_051066 [Brachionus plicatilis]
MIKQNYIHLCMSQNMCLDYLVTLASILAICVSSPVWEDACIFSPCQLGQICVPRANFDYECVDETSRLLNFKAPINFANDYEHDYDSCVSSPCSFGTICKSLPDNNYICLAEIDKSPRSQYARQIYKDMENKYALAIKDNLYDMAPSDHISVLKERRRPSRNPCDSSPCELGYTCQLDEQFHDGFSCVEDVFDMNVQKENKMNREYLQDKEFVRNITMECSVRELIDRLPNPKNPNQFIVCLEDYEFTISRFVHSN